MIGIVDGALVTQSPGEKVSHCLTAVGSHSHRYHLSEPQSAISLKRIGAGTQPPERIGSIGVGDGGGMLVLETILFDALKRLPL